MAVNLQDRLARLARALCLRPGLQPLDVQHVYLGGRRAWWIIGCLEGDQPLPMTSHCHTLSEALDAAEAWLAPELDSGSR